MDQLSIENGLAFKNSKMESSREPEEWWSAIAAAAPSTASPSPSDDDEELEAQRQQASSTSAPSTPRPSSSALLWASRALFAGAAVSGGVMLLNYLRGRMAADGTPSSPSMDAGSGAGGSWWPLAVNSSIGTSTSTGAAAPASLPDLAPVAAAAAASSSPATPPPPAPTGSPIGFMALVEPRALGMMGVQAASVLVISRIFVGGGYGRRWPGSGYGGGGGGQRAGQQAGGRALGGAAEERETMWEGAARAGFSVMYVTLIRAVLENAVYRVLPRFMSGAVLKDHPLHGDTLRDVQVATERLLQLLRVTRRASSLEAGAETIEAFYRMWNVHGVVPEGFNLHKEGVSQPGYPLRPELAESAMYMHVASGDPICKATRSC